MLKKRSAIPPSQLPTTDERCHHAAVLTKKHPDAFCAALVRLSRRYGLLKITVSFTQPKPVLSPVVQCILQALTLFFCHGVAGHPA